MPKQSKFAIKENESKKQVLPKYVDLLEEDKPIASQKFVCISFVSPENILKNKQMFFFEEFLKKYEFNKSMEKFIQFLNFVSYKYNVKFEDLTTDFTEFVKEEQKALGSVRIEDEYKTFLDKNEEELEKVFSIRNNFQTSTRGLKVRGVFPTLGEAELRCKMLREMDPNHDVFVGPVGLWMPWDPEAYKTGRVEYLEQELNQLMQEKQKNEINAKNTFDQRVKETRQNAINENIKLAEKSGNKLTQSVDENGNLIGVNNLNTQENVLTANNEISSADIHRELFEGSTIVMNKKDTNETTTKSDAFII
jgi:hypothetical protein